MEAGSLLRRARRAARLTQGELAFRAGTSQSAVNRYERGAAIPTLPTLERLLAACGRELTLSSRPLVRRTLPPHVRRHSSRLQHVATRHGVSNVRVFGSAARGARNSRSDIDLLVDLDPDRSLVDLAAFRREAAEILGVPVDVATPQMLRETVRVSAIADAVPL